MMTTPSQSAVTDKLSAEVRKELEERKLELTEKILGLEKKRKSMIREVDLLEFRLR